MCDHPEISALPTYPPPVDNNPNNPSNNSSNNVNKGNKRGNMRVDERLLMDDNDDNKEEEEDYFDFNKILISPINPTVEIMVK